MYLNKRNSIIIVRKYFNYITANRSKVRKFQDVFPSAVQTATSQYTKEISTLSHVALKKVDLRLDSIIKLKLLKI